MRGYFAIGVEGISKPGNAGALVRTAHAFGAQFVFAVGGDADSLSQATDTSKAIGSVPFYHVPEISALSLPRHCSLIGVEITDEAIELPRFIHPRQAAYIVGPEGDSLSRACIARCAQVVRIPTRFAINLSLAGTIVMYDRMLSQRHWGARKLPDKKTSPSS
ncbi:MAG: RNA methyltransferase [Pseudomonadota bacterium]